MQVNIQRSKLLEDGMLHIEFLNGNSYLYSLQEVADIISAQQSVQADGATPCAECGSLLPIVAGKCGNCGTPRN